MLGAIARFAGFSILRFIAYIKDELLIVLGTSSSETVLPQMMQKMEGLGASKPVVGLVIPTGYSFNLDGTNIYMTLATLFLAQAAGADLSFGQYATIIAGRDADVEGRVRRDRGRLHHARGDAGRHPDNPVPVAAMTLVLGIDKFMSECRALTNLVGNGVATVVVSAWENELDRATMKAVLAHPVAAGNAVEEKTLDQAI